MVIELSSKSGDLWENLYNEMSAFCANLDFLEKVWRWVCSWQKPKLSIIILSCVLL